MSIIDRGIEKLDAETLLDAEQSPEQLPVSVHEDDDAALEEDPAAATASMRLVTSTGARPLSFASGTPAAVPADEGEDGPALGEDDAVAPPAGPQSDLSPAEPATSRDADAAPDPEASAWLAGAPASPPSVGSDATSTVVDPEATRSPEAREERPGVSAMRRDEQDSQTPAGAIDHAVAPDPEPAGDAREELPAHPPVGLSTTLLEEREFGYARTVRVGMLLIVLGIGGFVAWGVFAPLTSGTVAPGVIKVAGESKTVQHLEGGIVKEILVGEGDAVSKGQLLLTLDRTRTEATLRALQSQYNTLLARNARLEAERVGMDGIEFPAELIARASDPGVARLMEGERHVFEARRDALKTELGVLAQFELKNEEEINGVDAKRRSAASQLGYIDEELRAVQTLYDQGVFEKPRLLALKRAAARLGGDIGQATAQIARTRQYSAEAQLRMIGVRNEHAKEVADQVQQTEAELLRVREELYKAEDVVARGEIRSPRSGRVVRLQVHTPGGVIATGAPIMDIVPEDDTLIVEVQISPKDIDVVHPGLEAQVQLSAYNMRSVPTVSGRVEQVSADRIGNPQGGPAYYRARVIMNPDALAALEGVELYQGMPASVQIVTGTQTIFEYLIKPIEAGIRRGLLEE